MIDRAIAKATRQLIDIGGEFREARMALGLSQEFVANAARISRSRYSGIEAGKITTLSVAEINRIAAVLGLDTGIRVYPGGAAVRDAGHGGKLDALLQLARPPLKHRIEVALPISPDRWERRAWDAVLFGHGERTTIELEMRMRGRRHEAQPAGPR
jgi:transcriptional regulator with XRE-family HTH domain